MAITRHRTCTCVRHALFSSFIASSLFAMSTNDVTMADRALTLRRNTMACRMGKKSYQRTALAGFVRSRSLSATYFSAGV